MADLKITQLTEKTQVGFTDFIAIVDESGSPVTKKAQVQNLPVIGQVYNVKNYGAKGDAATDDVTTIQAAINAANTAGGGIVYFPSGTYNLSSNLSLTKPYTHLMGSGWTTVLKLNNAVNKYAITFNPAGSVRMDGVIIENLKIDCNASNQTTGGGGIDANGSAYCLFDKLWIEAPWDNGIYLHDDNLGGFGHHNNIRSCWFHLGTNTNGAGLGRGVGIHNSDENMVSDSVFESCGSAQTSAAQLFEDADLQTFKNLIFIANPSVASVECMKVKNRNMISGCSFDGGTNHQLELTGDFNSVTNCNFYQPISTSSCILASGAHNTISANSFKSSATPSASQSAINGSSASAPNWITNNVIKTDGAWSSAVIMGPTANHVRNNDGFVTENSGTATVANGVTTSVVTHGLGLTPVIQDIAITPTNNLGSAAKFWISTVTSTQFTINVDVNPGATTATFVWSIINKI